MSMNKWKTAGIAMLVLGTGAAVMTYQASQAKAQVSSPARPRTADLTPSNDVTDWPAGWPDLTNPPLDPKTKAILEALEKPIPMHFPNDTPLSDIKKYVQEATKGPGLPNGIPIYIDPIGLQDADKTMSSTVVMELEEIPLKSTLRLILRQLSLRYMVRDGLVTVTSTETDDEVTPFSIMQEKARRGELTREQYRQLVEALKLMRQVEALSIDDGFPASENAQPGGGGNTPGKGQSGGFR